MDERDDKREIESFIEEHDAYLNNELIPDLRSVFIESYEKVDCLTINDKFITLEDKIKPFSNLSLVNVNNSLRELRRYKGELENDIKMQVQHCNNSVNIEDVRDPLLDKIDCIINYINEQSNSIKNKAKDILRDIDNTPYGEEENRNRNALRFQELVTDLLEWLFIGELKRLEKFEIEDSYLKRDGGFEIEDSYLKRDGGFEIEDGFDAKARCNFPFTHIFIECKNYKKPSWRDIMQTFVYTLFCIDSGIFNTPLSLLVSRENPLPENSSWRIRNAIFTRKIEEETRLILFWDIKNMKEMVDNIRKDTDPFAILKREIRSFGTRIWNGG